MKTVIISRNDKELTRVPLNRKSLVAGRSPSCDAVVRYKGVKPVQFLIEHVSENIGDQAAEADFETGFWTLIDVSENELHQSGKGAAGGGAGIVIDETQQNFNGFDFKIVTDSLQATDLKKGVLSRSLDRTPGLSAAGGGDTDRSVVEVVYFRKDIDIVTNISHLNRKKTAKKLKLFPQQLPDFIFEWETGPDVKATIRSDTVQPNIEIFRRGERITADFNETKSVPMRADDMIHIETSNDDFYLRLVPETKVDLEKFSWFKDYMVRTTLAVLALISMLVFLVHNFSAPIVEKIEPPRIIQIAAPPPPPEVVQPPPPAPEPVVQAATEPEPQEKPPAKPEPIKKAKPVEEKPAQKKAADLAVAQTPKKKEDFQASKAAVVQQPKAKPKVGLNNNSKPANVNTIGLLAKLKNGQKATTQKVTADQVLNQGVVSDTMTGETGTVVVNKAPSGTIGRSNTPVNKNALAEASTTLSGATTADPTSKGNLAMADGKSRFSSGTQLKGLQGTGGGGAGTTGGGGSGAGVGGSGFDRGEAMSAVGGLDKDAIRKALRENRRAIANCYETALLTKRQLDGRMTFRWVISVEGSVSSIKLQSSEIGMPNFESCVETVIRGIRFPQAPNKMTTTVIYPFAFQGKK